ncbi:MAG TPA: PIN domain-containing protein [Bryobacteraceae bacterium]|nr:PIN domain-containing protein [Bryobacteraceae bacterium]
MTKQTKTDRPFFDTNVLIYAFVEDDQRSERARQLLILGGGISVQALNEFVRVFRYKLGKPWDEVKRALGYLGEFCPSPVPLTMETHERAVELGETYRYGIYDALVLAAALEYSADTLYSEDLQDGQRIEGLVIRDPFRVRKSSRRSSR